MKNKKEELNDIFFNILKIKNIFFHILKIVKLIIIVYKNKIKNITKKIIEDVAGVYELGMSNNLITKENSNSCNVKIIGDLLFYI